ncbi:hypothetical protein ACPCHQ_21960 [Ralstonia thomasii]|uniref:hypothetical protein n=1 Tax=Ralstonia thomasii TaxID=3058596 RepID=UPI003C2F5E34
MSDILRYNFRLNATIKAKLDKVTPSYPGRRSGFIRDAVTAYLEKPPQALADRPRLRGAEKTSTYVQICAVLTEEQIEKIKTNYPDVSVSVVIQAAVNSELKKARYRIADPEREGISENGKRKNSKNDDSNRGGRADASEVLGGPTAVRKPARSK